MSAISSRINPITLYVSEDLSNKQDLDDQCMKTVVASFEIMKGNLGFHVDFRLKNLESVEVTYLNGDGKEVQSPHFDKVIDVVALATRSILKHLRNGQCMEKDRVSFQAQRKFAGSQGAEEFGPFELKLTDEFSIQTEDNSVSHSYAWLTDRKLCVFFNRIDSEFLQKVETLLKQIC